MNRTDLHWADWLSIAVYLAVVLGMGLRLARRQHDTKDFFLGGRCMPWFAVGLSLIASLLSTVSYLGQPGEIIRHGIAYVAATNLVLPLAFLVITFLWLPFFMRLGLTSIYEYLELRFGLVARWLGAGLFVFILRLNWMAVVILTASRAVAEITYPSASRLLGITPDQWVLTVLLAVGVLATLYTMLGGIRAVIWTDVLQSVVFLVGLLLTIAFVAAQTGTGPMTWWRDTTSVHHEMKWASWDLAERTTLLWTCLNIFFWFVLTFTGDQVAVQRFFTTSSVKASLRSSGLYFGGLLLTHVLFALCGMALLSYYTLNPEWVADLAGGPATPADPNVADRVFPHFITFGLPIGVSGLLVAALFAAAMSSVDSGINSVSTVLTVDICRRLKPDLQPRLELALARALTVLIGLGCTALAWSLTRLPSAWNIIDVTVRTFDCALGPLGGLFIVGMFLPHVGQRAAVLSASCGFVLALILAWWAELYWLFGLTGASTLAEAQTSVARPSSFLINPIVTIFIFLLAAVMGALFSNPDQDKAKRYTWRAVVMGNSQPVEDH